MEQSLYAIYQQTSKKTCEYIIWRATEFYNNTYFRLPFSYDEIHALITLILAKPNANDVLSWCQKEIKLTIIQYLLQTD
ncbi:hypothetical protein KFK09_008835 [Dendrobium nobile]|uniref:Uncharacterized protein n=1 Tax=Dendrobium nobile TaxID=94219 RepID=A0A8T3BS14_DENNO|nr:hypothetical protein KFK09_008835 [Dendrobium nobile]